MAYKDLLEAKYTNPCKPLEEVSPKTKIKWLQEDVYRGEVLLSRKETSIRFRDEKIQKLLKENKALKQELKEKQEMIESLEDTLNSPAYLLSRLHELTDGKDANVG